MHALLHSVPPTQQQVTASTRLHQRTLGTHGQVWVSLLCGHCSFLLGPGVHKAMFVPSKSLFPQSCVSSGGSMVGLIATSSKRAYATPMQICCIQSPCGRPLLTCTSTGGTQTLLAQSLWVECAFCAFPALRSSGNQVLGALTVPGGPCVLITSPVLAAQFPSVP